MKILSGEVEMEQIRTFIAIELPDEVRAGLAGIQEELKRRGEGVKWVRPEGIHLTLKFLGNVPADRIEEIIRAVREACVGFSPFQLSFAGLGCFPNLRRPRVIWVGVEGETETLARLQKAIEDNLDALGFPREKRGFSPHLTLGRVRREVGSGERRRLGQLIEATATDQLGEMVVESISVMRSDLKPTGAVYTRLAVVKLEGKGGN